MQTPEAVTPVIKSESDINASPNLSGIESERDGNPTMNT